MTVQRPHVSHTVLGVGVVALVVAALAADFTGVLRRLREPPTRTISAVFANTQQLRDGDPVRVDGVEEGHVEHIALDRNTGRSVVRMRIARDTDPVYADARATLRWRTLLGGAFVVNLSRGHATAGALRDATIPITNTANQVEIDAIATVVRGAARHGLQTMPREMADALRDPDAPAHAFGALAAAAPDITSGIGALRGERPDRDLRDLVAATAKTVSAFDEPAAATRRLISGTAATLQTTAARHDDIEAALDVAPVALRQATSTLQRLDVTLDELDPLIAHLRRPAGAIAPALAQLRPTVTQADALLRRADPLTRDLRPALRSLRRTAARGGPLLDALAPSLRRIDTTILPFMDEVDPETKVTAAEAIGPAVAGVGPGSGGQMDSNGHIFRFPITAGSGSTFLPCQLFVGDTHEHLVACEDIRAALETYLSYNPLQPAPGTAPPPTGSAP